MKFLANGTAGGAGKLAAHMTHHNVEAVAFHYERLHLTLGCMLLRRLVDSFGSTRRRRQLNAREEGVVRTEKLVSAGALSQLINQTAASAAAQGLTKDEVCMHKCIVHTQASAVGVRAKGRSGIHCA